MFYLAPACFLFGISLVAISGVFRHYRYSIGALASGCCLIFGCAVSALMAKTWFINLPRLLPGGSVALQMDAIAAWFLLPLSAIPPAISAYGHEYWGKSHSNSAKKMRLLLGFSTASLCLIPVAAHGILFAIVWELLAIFGFLMVIGEDSTDEARHAGWVYLGAGHVSVLCLIAAFGLMAKINGGGFFAAIPAGWVNTGDGIACFLLFLAGFAIKAGLFPFHFWLPIAHGAVPCQVAAFSSGLGVKVGLLGLFRLLLWVPDPPLWWAGCILILGVLSALLGAINSVVQKDYTRFLAFSTVENMGIIAIALSLAFAGKALNQPLLMALGIAGGLIHVLNHCITKPLLFFGAGAILYATGTRDIEQLGGLAKQQQKIAVTFLFGSIAICGLPPLFGFVGKWIILMGAFEGFMHGNWIWAATALASIALASGLTMLAYTRTFGMIFLGWPRNPVAKKTKKIPNLMVRPILILVYIAAALSLLPVILMPALQPLLDLYGQTDVSMGTLPGLLDHVPMVALGLLTCLISVFAVIVWRWIKKVTFRLQPTWDCGYAKTSPRVQYTASGFAQIANDFFSGTLLNMKSKPHIRGAFPGQSHYSTKSPDLVLKYGVNPVFHGAAWLMARLRIAQGGLLPIYLLYVVITLLILLAWTLA